MTRDERVAAHDFDIKALARFLRTHFRDDAEMEAARRITGYVQFNDREVAAIWEQVLGELQRQKANGEDIPLQLTSQSEPLHQRVA